MTRVESSSAEKERKRIGDRKQDDESGTVAIKDENTRLKQQLETLRNQEMSRYNALENELRGLTKRHAAVVRRKMIDAKNKKSYNELKEAYDAAAENHKLEMSSLRDRANAMFVQFRDEAAKQLQKYSDLDALHRNYMKKAERAISELQEEKGNVQRRIKHFRSTKMKLELQLAKTDQDHEKAKALHAEERATRQKAETETSRVQKRCDNLKMEWRAARDSLGQARESIRSSEEKHDAILASCRKSNKAVFVLSMTIQEVTFRSEKKIKALEQALVERATESGEKIKELSQSLLETTVKSEKRIEVLSQAFKDEVVKSRSLRCVIQAAWNLVPSLGEQYQLRRLLELSRDRVNYTVSQENIAKIRGEAAAFEATRQATSDPAPSSNDNRPSGSAQKRRADERDHAEDEIHNARGGVKAETARTVNGRAEDTLQQPVTNDTVSARRKKQKSRHIPPPRTKSEGETIKRPDKIPSQPKKTGGQTCREHKTPSVETKMTKLAFPGNGQNNSSQSTETSLRPVRRPLIPFIKKAEPT